MNKKENFIRAITGNQPGWIPYCWESSFKIVAPSFIERPEQEGYDSWGCYWHYNDTSGSYPSEQYLIKNADDIRNFQAPDAWQTELLGRAIEEINELDSNETFILCSNHIGIHERAYILMGMENYLVSMAENPGLIQELFTKIADFKLQFTIRMLEELPVDGIWLGDDWGTQRGLFFSPQLWRDLIKPHMKAIYDEIHKRGKFVFQHSCGWIEEIIPDLVEIGMDVWNPCQPCNDLTALKSKFAEKLTFMGGVDASILASGDPQAIAREVKHRIRQMGQGGRYILEPSHHLDFSLTALETFKNCAQNLGKYEL